MAVRPLLARYVGLLGYVIVIARSQGFVVVVNKPCPRATPSDSIYLLP